MPYATVSIPVGTTYGRLTTTGDPYLKQRSDGRNRSWVPAVCICGTAKNVVANNLLTGVTQSCGCLQKERASEANTTHGQAIGYARSPLLRIWRGMNERCRNPNAVNYRWYGAKGVGIEWPTFDSFLDWSLENGWSPGLEIDRKDVDSNYGPSNCRWVTKKANIRSRDRLWDDELDASLVRFAATQGKSPYDVIQEAVREYLSERLGVSL